MRSATSRTFDALVVNEHQVDVAGRAQLGPPVATDSNQRDAGADGLAASNNAASHSIQDEGVLLRTKRRRCVLRSASSGPRSKVTP